VADLEAELDDPFPNEEWEQFDNGEAAEARVEREATTAPQDTPAAFRSARQVNTSEVTQTASEAMPEDADPERNFPSSDEVAESGDVSEADQGVYSVVASIDHLNVEESPVPTASTSSEAQVSNATVQPVNIISRKPLSNGSSTRLAEPNLHDEHGIIRTPSPNGLQPSSMDAMTGVEGPMTPRNDAGPFIFDGSAGRAAGMRLATVASMNLDEAADTPIRMKIPQPQTSAEL
jgi:hypothetical protein